MNISRIDEMIMAQEGAERLDRRCIRRIQLEKLNALLRRERERGGFYAGLPIELGSLEELSALPFTTGEELASHVGGMLTVSQADVRRVVTDATSGSSGAAKRVFYTQGDCESTVQLFAAGLGELIYPGSVTMICMPISGPAGLGELIAQAVTRLGAEPLKLGTALSYGELKTVLDGRRPDSYVGFPSNLLSMLRMCGRGSLRRALISGDACPRAVTDGIEDILGSRVFPHYGSREMGLAGAICCQAHEGMHLRENAVIAEIVDSGGNVLPDGSFGELVISTVGLEAMPLIRYRTGDYTRIIPGVCPCGSEVLRLDTVTRLRGRDMPALDEALFKLPYVVDFRAGLAGSAVRIYALTTGEGSAEEISAAAGGVYVETRAAQLSDGALYRGKRGFMRAQGS